MPSCYILDDQYWEKIYWEMKKVLPDWSFPIQNNIQSPLSYVDKILQEQPEYILLDNYFPGEYREEALGNDFLKKILEKTRWKNILQSKIVCISDYGEQLLEKYEYWNISYQNWYVIAFISSKSGNDIAKKIIKTEKKSHYSLMYS